MVIGALDASDAHHKLARGHFEAWRTAGVARLMSAVTLTEVLVAPAAEPARLLLAREALAALEVGIHRPTESIAVDAARLRGRHPISLPDAYALATARHLDARLASFDQRVLRAAEVEGIG